ncbi:MAG: hypothetical protein IPO75_15845 [Betaproteobacteria bacterium]|nr:hypothetical protein [Betaproteobacteria bacterium]
MVMLSANSVLVAGSVAGEPPMANQQIKVVRPFWFGGKQRQAGTVFDVPAGAAAELVAMGKAVKHEPPPKPAPRVEPPKDEK